MALLIYTSAEAMALVDAGKIDLCLGRFSDVPDGLECKMIVESSMSLAFLNNHPIIDSEITLERMAQYPIVTLHRRMLTRANIEKSFTDRNLPATRFIEARTCQTALTMAAQGEGIAIIHSLCTSSAPDQRLRFADLGDLFEKMRFFAVYRKKAKSQAISEVLEALTSADLR